MERSFDLLEHFPDRWRDLKEIQAICNSDLKPVNGHDEHTLPHLWKCLENELNNVFILPYGDKPGADADACSRWESILGIFPPNDDTLEDRQFRIYTKLIQTLPYSYKNVQKMLDDLVGNENYKMTRDVGKKTLDVKVSLGGDFEKRADSITDLLDNIVPANIILNIKIAYTTYDNMSAYTHEELSAYTHKEITTTEM